jgi:four helix bundle protein
MLDELLIYRMAMDIGQQIWAIVAGWPYFAKDTIGKQFVRAADSIAANLSEGYGRYFYKENKQFCYYARGSLQETKTWLKKASDRNLISPSEFQSLSEAIETLSVKLNHYIKTIGAHDAHAVRK